MELPPCTAKFIGACPKACVLLYATSCLPGVRRGHSFLSTNQELLERYAACATSVQVIEVQTAWLNQAQSVPAALSGALSLLLGDQGVACTAWHSVSRPLSHLLSNVTWAAQACR